MANSEESARRGKPAEVFENIRTLVKSVLKQYGQPDTALKYGDYTVEGDYLGASEIVVFVGNLAMLEPNIIDKLHDVIKGFPD